MISDEEIAEKVAYAKERIAIANQLHAEGVITDSEKLAMVVDASKPEREGPGEAIPFVPVAQPAMTVPTAAPVPVGNFSTMRLPSGKPLTYDILRNFAYDLIIARSSEKTFKISYGPKIVAGLNKMLSLYCTTAYTACSVVQPRKAVQAAIIKRCEYIRKEVKKVKATNPADVIIPKDMAVDPTELKIMESSEKANKKVYVLGGRLAWVKALTKYGGYEGYKTLEELKSEYTQLKAMKETAGNYYRNIEPFLQYIESNNIDIRTFGPAELRSYGMLYRAEDFLAKKAKYNAKVAYYEAEDEDGRRINKTIYKRDLRRKMTLKGLSREQAIPHVPTKPTILSWTTVSERLNAISNFFEKGIGINFPPNPNGIAVNPLMGVHIPREKTEVIPYRLELSERKVLDIASDDIIRIYRAILNAPMKEQYKRGIFILLRLIRETGARPANIVWLRWEDFPKREPRQINWTYAGGKKVKGKGAPTMSYISKHLAEDIDAYRRDYKPDKEDYVAGSGIFDKQDLVISTESGFRVLDKEILSIHITRLSKFTGGIPVQSMMLRNSYASLIWACIGETKLVESLTGDQASTVRDHYVDTGQHYVIVPEKILNKFSPAEVARKVFDQEYPVTDIPDKYVKIVERYS